MYAEPFWITSVAFHSRKYRVSFKRAIRRSAMLLDNDPRSRRSPIFRDPIEVLTDDYNGGIDATSRRRNRRFDNEACPRLSEYPVRKSACVCDHYSYRNYNNNYCYYY